MVEISLVRLGAQHTRHTGDIKTEESTANGGEGANEIDIACLVHHADRE